MFTASLPLSSLKRTRTNSGLFEKSKQGKELHPQVGGRETYDRGIVHATGVLCALCRGRGKLMVQDGKDKTMSIGEFHLDARMKDFQASGDTQESGDDSRFSFK